MDMLQSYLPAVVRTLKLRQHDGCRLVLIQHLFDDTYRMIKALQPHVEIDLIVGIPYSSRRPGLAACWSEQLGVRVVVPDDLKALDTLLVEEFERIRALCRADGKQMILQEVGGFGVPILHERFGDDLSWVRGAVEITKQGVWRAQRLAHLALPVLHCAESELKRLEASLCGDSIVSSVDQLMRSRGMCVAGQRSLVFGHGWIGRGVAHALRARGAIVAVADPDPLKLVEARLSGFLTPDPELFAEQANLVVGAAGTCSIHAAILERLPDQAVVASGSSRDLEIDLPWLRRFPQRPVGPSLREYRVGSKSIFLVNDGYPANFVGTSVPDEIVEMILAELIVLIAALAAKPYPPGVYPIAREAERIPAEVWLRMRDGLLEPATPKSATPLHPLQAEFH